MGALHWLATQLSWENRLVELRTLQRTEVRTGRALPKAA
jgi:hypothetical protein